MKDGKMPREEKMYFSSQALNFNNIYVTSEVC